MRRAAVAALAAWAAMALGACGGATEPGSSEAGASTTASTASAPDASTDVTVRRVEGMATVTDADGTEHPYSFTFDADGSFVYSSPGLESYAYDAAADRFEGSGEGTESPDAVVTHLSLGAPDYSGRDSAFFFRRDLGWLVAALARSDDPAIGTTRMLGRPSWTYESGFQPNKLAGPEAPDHVAVVVDQQTSLPLQVIERAGTKVVQRLEVTTLLIDESTDRERFHIVTTPSETTDDGWARIDEDRAEVRVDTVPEGYEPDAAAVNAEPRQTGPEASNPAVGRATALRWTRGLDELVVTVRPSGPEVDVWSDPFGGEGMFLDVDHRTLMGGLMDGVKAEVVLDAQSVPHLWAVDGRRVITVAGNATAEELVAVAQSIRAT